MTDQPRALLKVEEAAERLAISRTMMFSYIKSGAVESIKVGRLRRIPADAIDAYIKRLSSEQKAA
jgi:excisionase family DNA binding protein